VILEIGFLDLRHARMKDTIPIMDVRTLSTFSAAARSLSFTNAALSLGYAQSSVTAQIKGLEEDLGTALFNRVGNRLELTEPGLRFLTYAERILALTEEAKASIQDDEGVGTIRFTAPESICTYLLPPVLKAFMAKFPRVRLQFLPGFVRDFKRQVLDGAVDLAFILEEPFPSKALAVEKLRDEQVLILAAPAHRLAARASVSAMDLMDDEVLLKALGCSYRNQFERQLIAAGAHPGSFLAHVDYPVGAGPVAVKLADLNGDGIPDSLPSDGGSTFQPSGPLLPTQSRVTGSSNGTSRVVIWIVTLLFALMLIGMILFEILMKR